MSECAFDVLVVGGGHAGIEAALAAARMGMATALVTLDSRAIGRMSCNPAIGGLGKGQMVRELDALGGEMAHAVDDCGIQFHMLNTRKGPAVRAPRAQCDKHRYQDRMARVCLSTENLTVLEGKAEELIIASLGSSVGGAAYRLLGLKLADGSELRGRAAVLTNGTFLRGLLHCGFEQTKGGRVGEDAAYGLSPFLERLGFERGRLKTGTPPRVEASTVDWSRTTPQPGDDPPVPFSHSSAGVVLPQVPCHIAHTNEETHAAIRENLHRSPMYSGVISGIGPRYCPSIEDKVVRFSEKERHQIFLEPEGLDTSWIYLNGLSTSLPKDVQDQVVTSVPALKNARILQYGYAVEYDFFPPTQIRATFETKLVEGLYFAGQICGTSGYEEAAGQGFLAGVNAVLKLRARDPLILERSDAYLGVLVDDLVVECPREPYRMFTSRAEYRLLLRSDNADVRLMETGHKLGLIPAESMRRLEQKKRQVAAAARYMETHRHEGKDLLRLLRQPEHSYRDVEALDPGLQALSLSDDEAQAVEVEAKYATYIDRQNQQIEKWKRMERRVIPENFDYGAIKGIRAESREKLGKVRPRSVGQASRISGVTPADLGVLILYLDLPERRKGVS